MHHDVTCNDILYLIRVTAHFVDFLSGYISDGSTEEVIGIYLEIRGFQVTTIIILHNSLRLNISKLYKARLDPYRDTVDSVLTTISSVIDDDLADSLRISKFKVPPAIGCTSMGTGQSFEIITVYFT